MDPELMQHTKLPISSKQEFSKHPLIFVYLLFRFKNLEIKFRLVLSHFVLWKGFICFMGKQHYEGTRYFYYMRLVNWFPVLPCAAVNQFLFNQQCYSFTILQLHIYYQNYSLTRVSPPTVQWANKQSSLKSDTLRQYCPIFTVYMLLISMKNQYLGYL